MDSARVMFDGEDLARFAEFTGARWDGKSNMQLTFESFPKSNEESRPIRSTSWHSRWRADGW